MKMRTKDSDYFEAFVTAVGFCCAAAAKLSAVIDTYQPESLHAHMQQIHEIEHQADMEKHHLTDRLHKEFLTPIEREDIAALSHEIDEVTDRVEDIVIGLYIFNVQTLHPDASAFTALISECCRTLEAIMQEFRHFRGSTSLLKHIIEINTLEEQGDALYMRAVRTLYEDEKDPLEVLVWTEIFGRFERCCDACEHAADVVESVIMKNT